MEERNCAICYGPMGKMSGELCCQDEDKYLLIAAKGYLRDTDDRAAGIEQLVEGLYAKLAEFLRDRGKSIDDFEESGVLAEIERRVLRWINKEMLPVNAVKGIAFCSKCGVPIMAGRTICSRCGDAKSASQPFADGGSTSPKSVGMHLKRR